jgi:hypothetical protein
MLIVALDPRLPHDLGVSQMAFGRRWLGCTCRCLQLCAEAGVVKLGHVALDGTKIKANASKHKAMSYEHMKKREADRENACGVGMICTAHNQLKLAKAA